MDAPQVSATCARSASDAAPSSGTRWARHPAEPPRHSFSAGGPRDAHLPQVFPDCGPANFRGLQIARF